ncbi:MAG: HAD family hydrolase [Deltaproteobacteria bacterium]|jgi:hypothetical protein|nr:HAD family hydrolase [Deltaproteobacteria bacterium]
MRLVSALPVNGRGGAASERRYPAAVQPISELPRDLARALRGVCFDIDDTVTTDGILDPLALQALCDLRASGLHLVASTGRPLGWAEIVARTWPVDAAVGENGAGWVGVVRGRPVRGYFDPADLREQHQERFAALRDQVGRVLPQLCVTDDAWARRCDLAFDVGEFQAPSEEEVAALVRLIEGAGARAVVSSVHAHAAFGEADKASGAIRAVRELLGIDLAAEAPRWLFVGDSGNDAAAFSWFPVTAGVANVRDFLDALPDPPRYVAEGHSGRGFAEIAEVLLEARRQP